MVLLHTIVKRKAHALHSYGLTPHSTELVNDVSNLLMQSGHHCSSCKAVRNLLHVAQGSKLCNNKASACHHACAGADGEFEPPMITVAELQLQVISALVYIATLTFVEKCFGCID